VLTQKFGLKSFLPSRELEGREKLWLALFTRLAGLFIAILS
jgi:hypothetical protein